ncbi:hypothetical protein GH714_033386 [Hevea brasiliensis]|uniref:O-methyltransferase dimerisation domain-containing protein n=1 Tax=Hevea brasiliensis TaxID=3981 RepID=A0A6A6LPW8_HEVBR|nr:hypothetical protein GH714_033386 [Hevea brasiliensis]
MWKYIFGFANVAAVKCAIELGVADAIQNHHSPITLNPIVDGTIGYVQTPLSRRLLGRGGNSMESLFLLESSPVMLKPWHFLNDRVRLDGNTAAFEAAHGNDIWKYAAVNPDHSKLIDDAMACHARMDVPRMIERCPEVFDGIKLW